LSDQTQNLDSLRDEITNLKEYKERLRLFEETTFEAITVYDENLRCVDTNGMTTTLFRYSREEVLGMSGLDFFDPDYRETARDSVRRKNREPYEARMRRKDGTTFLAIIQGTSISVNGRNLRVSTCRDITELNEVREEARQKADEFQTIFETSPVGIFLTNESRVIIKANLAAARIFGYGEPGDLVGQDIRIIHLSDESYVKFGEFYRGALINREPLKFDYRFRKRDGEPVWVNVSGAVVDHSDPPDLRKGVIWCCDDISARKAAEEELIRLSRTDPLTGVLNRGYFIELGEWELKSLHRHERSLSLLMLDIDNFKQINDTYGHAVGDEALRFFATHCLANIRDTDLLGRLGGEEFAILLLECEIDTAYRTAETIRTRLKELSAAKEGIPTMTVSIGLVKAGKETLEAALGRADELLYRAKNLGKDRTCY